MMGSSIYRPLWRRVIRLQPRAVAPYGSHIPVLLACCRIFEPKRVLELGMGRWSTPFFLSREAAACVRDLHSVENDPAWFHEICADAAGDERFRPTLTALPICEYVRSLDLRQYDLIFIDDSPSAAERARTIRNVLRARPRCPVVVHDADLPRLRLAFPRRPRRVIFDAFNPQTAVFSPDAWARGLLCSARAAQRDLPGGARNAPDLQGWIRVGTDALPNLERAERPLTTAT